MGLFPRNLSERLPVRFISETNVSVPLKIKLKIDFSLENDYSNQNSLIIQKGKFESMTHIILKLLAFLYFYKSNRELIIEPKFRFRGFRPDLVAFKNPEIPNEITPDIDTWIECKKVKISKLKKLARYLPTSHIYWFHLNHYITKKMATILDSKNVKLVEVQMTQKDLSQLGNSLLKQSPTWNVEQSKDSQMIIGILDHEFIIEFHVIKSSSLIR